jgi:DNA (cytosine-5)-methyltransferase 1
MNDRRPMGIELFCGVGGMSLGFEQAGFDVVAAFDTEPINVEIHSENHPQCRTLREDVTRLTAKKIRDLAGIGNRQIDVLFGGPPCQGFSEIGKRRIDDPRNRLLYDFARLVAGLRPSYFVIENVEGILFSRTSSTLEECLWGVQRAGYSIVRKIKAINACDFGVPQDRKRVFIIGARKGLPLPDYPEPRGVACNGDASRVTVWEAIGDLPDIDLYDDLLTSNVYRGRLAKPSAYAKILRGHVRDPEDRSRERTINGDGLTGCMRVLHKPEIVKRFEATEPGTYDRRSRLFRLKKDGLSKALRAGTLPAHGSFTAARPIHPVCPRCISVREGARLHSFPDWYVFHPTKWHGFRQVGNAVPPLLARRVAMEIIKLL